MSLAVSDLGVSLLSQPLYVAYLVMLLRENTQRLTFDITSNLSEITSDFLAYASFFGVVVLTADTFLAAYFYLRYQEQVTHKRVVAVVILIWILSVILMLLFIWIPLNTEEFISIAVDGVCYLTTALLYFKIYSAVRHYTKQIHVLPEQLAQNNGEDMANFIMDFSFCKSIRFLQLVQ